MLVEPMVQILHGNLEHDSHVIVWIFWFVTVLDRSKCVKANCRYHFTRAHLFLNYHPRTMVKPLKFPLLQIQILFLLHFLSSQLNLLSFSFPHEKQVYPIEYKFVRLVLNSNVHIPLYKRHISNVFSKTGFLTP